MEAQQVIDKILSDAKAEAARILQQARQKEADEQASLDRELGEYTNTTQQLAEKAAEEEKAHLLAAARMEIAKLHLAEKRKILDEVFDQARSRIQNMPDGDYRSLMKKLMLEAVETGDEQVVVGRNENRIDMEFIKDVNRELGPGFKGNLSLVQDERDTGGGFILRRGKIKTNVSIDVLLDQARKSLEIELARDLFGN